MAKKDPEAELTKLAAQRRAEHKRSPEGISKRLTEVKGEFERNLHETLQSVQTVIKRVDHKGTMQTEVVHGIAGGRSTKDSVTRSNHRSRRERADALTAAIRDVSATIEAVEKGKELSADFDVEEYIEAWLQKIPDRNVMEAI